MSDLRKAAKISLDALEEINKLSIGKNAISLPAEIDTAMDALRAALAKCNYPDCVDTGPDGKCTRWLLGECEKSEDYKSAI